MRALAAAVLALVIASGARSARAQDETPAAQPTTDGTVVRVVTKPLVPFVEIQDDGAVEGFSIDLWDEIASRNGWTTEWVQTETVGDLLDVVAGGGADAGIAGISVTREREELYDFSHPMFDSGLQILARADERRSITELVGGTLGASLLKFFVAVLLIIVISGHVVWLVQRRRADVPESYLKGVGHGMWISAATALAGDLAEGAPARPLGRLIAISWILMGVIALAVYTAALTSQLTVDSIDSEISGLADLGDAGVVTVEGSTSDLYLTRIGIEHDNVEAVDDAYALLRNSAADAVVYDAPVLRYFANTPSGAGLALVGSIFNPESYGIAFPVGSDLREQVNRALLDIRSDGTYERLVTRWFGE